jgi:hypothetical protein
MNSKHVNKILVPLLSLYFAAAGFAALYFNWEFARSNGFLPWLLLGEITPTAKAIAWPYFAFRADGGAGRVSVVTEIERTRLTPRQISEMEVKKLLLSC